MLTIFALQSLIPLALVLWLAIVPRRSTIGFWTQALATSAGITAIGLTGLWLFPPYWAPWILGLLVLFVCTAALTRRQIRPRWPDNALGWASLVAFAAMGIYSAQQVRLARQGHVPPEGRIVDLALPLAPGTYLVANGGAALGINAHNEVLDATVLRHRPWRGEAYGVDLVAINPWGFRARGVMPKDPSKYRIFGTPIIAPCAGKVIVAVDGLPDMSVPQMDSANPAGNHIFLRCGDANIVLAHFRNGSLRVHVGQALKSGEPIAEVGNSGNTGEPHLHIHAQTPGTAGTPFSGTPIPVRINGLFLVRNDRLVVGKSIRRP